MIGYLFSIFGIMIATLVPAYIALYFVKYLRMVKIRYIAAAGIGLVFWFFFDTMGDAAQLDVNESFSGGLTHFGVVLCFLAGILALAVFDHFAVPFQATEKDMLSAESKTSTGISMPDISRISQKIARNKIFGDVGIAGNFPGTAGAQKSSSTGAVLRDRQILYFLIPSGIAAVMGIHGLGEGWDFASVASATPTTSIVQAFGDLYAVISYPMHKFLEAAIIGALYAIFVARNKFARTAKWHIPVLGLLFGLTSVIGASVGYFVSMDTTYFYAFGVTAAIYAVMRLAEPIVQESIHPASGVWQIIPAYFGSRVFLAIAIGFFLLYSAALFH